MERSKYCRQGRELRPYFFDQSRRLWKGNEVINRYGYDYKMPLQYKLFYKIQESFIDKYKDTSQRFYPKVSDDVRLSHEASRFAHAAFYKIWPILFEFHREQSQPLLSRIK